MVKSRDVRLKSLVATLGSPPRIIVPGVDFLGTTGVYFCHDRDGNFLMRKGCHGFLDEKGKWNIGSEVLRFGDLFVPVLKFGIERRYCTTVLGYEKLGFREIRGIDDKGQPTHFVAHDYKVLVSRKAAQDIEPGNFDVVEWFNQETIPDPSLLHSHLPNFFEEYSGRLFS